MNSDVDLIYMAKSAGSVSFEQFIMLYDRKIYGFVYNIVRNEEAAKDITQDTFVRVFENINGLDKDRNFISWLFTVAKNTAFNYIKKYRKYEYIEVDEDMEQTGGYSGFGDPAEVYEEKQKLLSLVEEIDKLPEKYRELIYMKYVLGLKYEEISERTELPFHKVESRLYMARQKLLKQIEKVKHRELDKSVGKSPRQETRL
ncbi:MAG: RNA polymerase sigma factor [Bacillota bacterium]|nr:RNA polymerase sigma factor [Bacillota bacterium]